MKQILSRSVVLIILLSFFCCDNNDFIDKKIQENIFLINPKDEPFLIEKINLLFNESARNARTSFSRGDIDLQSAIKVVNNKGNKVSYSFKFKYVSRSQFSNFVFSESKSAQKSYFLYYSPSKTWLKNSKFDIAKFTGSVTGINLNGDTISYASIVNGKAFSKLPSSKSNGRIQGGLPLIPDSAGCYDLIYSTATGSYFWLDVVCGQGGPSGGTIDNGGTSTGGTPPTTGGSFTGSNDPTTGGNGNQTGGGGSSVTGSGASLGIVVDVNVVSRIIELEGLLAQDPNKLLGVPCNQLPKWQALAQQRPDQTITSKLQAIKANYKIGDVAFQAIQNASGAIVNLDYFPVTINTLPNNPSTGQRFTAPEFLNYIRTHMNDFVNPSITSFSPSTITGFNEAQIWNSNNPKGGVVHLNISGGAGDGSVICSLYDSNHWIFSTIEVPYNPFVQGKDGIHPVSGSREFGFLQNSNGSYTFYTRGADRITDALDAFVANNILTDPFQNPDALWASFKNGIYNFTQLHSGVALTPSASEDSIYRPDWSKVKDVLLGQQPISSLGCN